MEDRTWEILRCVMDASGVDDVIEKGNFLLYDLTLDCDLEECLIGFDDVDKFNLLKNLACFKSNSMNVETIGNGTWLVYYDLCTYYVSVIV